LRGQTPVTLTCPGKARERRKASKEWSTGLGSSCVAPQPATPTTNPLAAALPVVEPRTTVIPYAIAASTPLPVTRHNPTVFAAATFPPTPAKPSGNPEWGGFPRPVAQSAMAYCSAGCTIEGDGSQLTWTHQVTCLRSEGKPIVLPPTPEPQHSMLKKILCPYCNASTHTAWTIVRISSRNPHPDRIPPTNLLYLRRC